MRHHLYSGFPFVCHLVFIDLEEPSDVLAIKFAIILSMTVCTASVNSLSMRFIAVSSCNIQLIIVIMKLFISLLKPLFNIFVLATLSAIFVDFPNLILVNFNSETPLVSGTSRRVHQIYVVKFVGVSCKHQPGFVARGWFVWKGVIVDSAMKRSWEGKIDATLRK